MDTPSTMRPSAEEVQAWLIDYISGVIDMPEGPFPVAETFDSYGLDSVETVIMAGMLEERFAIRLEQHEPFEHPTVQALARYLAAKADTPDEG